MTEFPPIEVVDADQLVPSAYNPRQADEARLNLVALSLSRLGWLLPLYATPDGEILSGHQRHLVATEMLGATKVPVVRVAKDETRDRMAVNVLYNRATNDLEQHEGSRDITAELLEQAEAIDVAREEWDALDLNDPSSWAALLACEEVDAAEVMGTGGTSAALHAANMAGNMNRSGLPQMPVVIAEDGRIVNGAGRAAWAAKHGRTVQVVRVPDDRAEVARLMLNRLSMDFSLDDRYRDVLRANSYRRPSNSQKYLVHAHTAALLRGTNTRTSKGAGAFDETNPKHLALWKRYYGDAVLDFGCGHGHQVDLLRSVGIDAVGFEPYPTTPGTKTPDPDVSRERAAAFLDRVADGTEFKSIFLNSVLNSIPFEEDRRKVIRIVQALSTTGHTSVHAVAVSTDSQRFRTYALGGAPTPRTGNAFMFDYEPNTSLGELNDHPKVQKFHTQPEWEGLWRDGFKRIEEMRPGVDYVGCIAREPKPVDPDLLAEAVWFEFNDLPYTDGTVMGLGEQALAAFSKRLDVVLDVPAEGVAM